MKKYKSHHIIELYGEDLPPSGSSFTRWILSMYLLLVLIIISPSPIATGIVSQSQPVCIVMELMEYGDLKTFLRRHREDLDDPLPPLSDGNLTLDRNWN